MLTTAIPDNFL